MELPNNPTDQQRLEYLRWHLADKPNSLPLRNALVSLEKHLGLEPTVMGICPKKFIEALTERLESPSSVDYTVRLIVPRLTVKQWLRLVARKLGMFLRRFRLGDRQGRHKKTTRFKEW